PPPSDLSTLSLHDALPISLCDLCVLCVLCVNSWIFSSCLTSRQISLPASNPPSALLTSLPIQQSARNTPLMKSFRPSSPKPPPRSEEHTSELQSPCNLVCR